MYLLHKCLLLVLIWLSVLLSNAQSTDEFTLTGTLVGVDTGMLYLGFYSDAEQKPIEYSSTVKNGKFQFNGKLDVPVFAFIRRSKSRVLDNNTAEIFLEPTVMNMRVQPDKFNELHLSGSKTQADHEQLRDEKAEIYQAYEKERKLLSDPAYQSKRDSLQAIFQSYDNALRKKDLTFFTTHPQSTVTLYMLQRYINNLPADSFAHYYSRLGTKLQNTFIGKSIYERMEKVKSGQVGSLAPSFVTVDRNGTAVMSRFFKGSYILLDFWASWCVPCREGNPQIIQLFLKYRNKNFAIVSISDDDRDSAAWRNAIEKDGTDLWTHVLRGANPDLKAKGIPDPNDLNDKFGVAVLPTMILLDKNGLVIGRYKGSEEMSLLEKKLAEVIK